MRRLQIDPALVERYLTDLATYGAWGETGVVRLVYSPEWVGAMRQLAAWFDEAGLQVRRDAVGNLWGRLEGSAGGPAIVSGSHVDSQRPGGRYDGALGVIGALVALRTLREQLGRPKHPIEVVAFCEEESSRFPAANFWGSRAVIGAIANGEADVLQGYDGQTIAAAMRSVGLDPAQIPTAARQDIDTFIELHIEQGPVLEQAGRPVGVVTAITGLRHYLVEVRGRSDHAGAMPMDLRLDPMAGAAEIISAVIDTAHSRGRPAVTTCGRIEATPNFPAIVPEWVRFTVDVRHPVPEALAELCAHHEAIFQTVATRRGLGIRWQVTLNQSPCALDPGTVQVIAEAARDLSVPTMFLHSGAGHDSQVMARRFKVGMIFVQSKDGRSHTPAEFTALEHAVAGIETLAAALHRLAY